MVIKVKNILIIFLFIILILFALIYVKADLFSQKSLNIFYLTIKVWAS
jgi:hypothetical protein